MESRSSIVLKAGSSGSVKLSTISAGGLTAAPAAGLDLLKCAWPNAAGAMPNIQKAVAVATRMIVDVMASFPWNELDARSWLFQVRAAFARRRNFDPAMS